MEESGGYRPCRRCRPCLGCSGLLCSSPQDTALTAMLPSIRYLVEDQLQTSMVSGDGAASRTQDQGSMWQPEPHEPLTGGT